MTKITKIITIVTSSNKNMNIEYAYLFNMFNNIIINTPNRIKFM